MLVYAFVRDNRYVFDWKKIANKTFRIKRSNYNGNVQLNRKMSNEVTVSDFISRAKNDAKIGFCIT